MDTPALLFKTAFDRTNDGIPETVISETYSNRGYLIERLLDRSDISGIPDAVTTYTYDAQGNQTGLFVGVGNDSTVEYMLTTEYTVDASGNLTVTATGRDTATGHDILYTTVFNRDGNLIVETASAAGDQPASTQTYGYSESGQLTTYENFVDGIGTYRSEYTYNALDRIISSAFFIPDGTLSSSETYTYDEAGNFTGREVFIAEVPRVRLFDTYTYDEANRLIDLTSSYYPGTGSTEVVTRYTYAYNEAGQVTRYSTAFADSIGVPNSVFTYEYDDAGVLIQLTGDRENDGIPDYKALYTYDSLGRLIAEASDDGADGTIDSTVTYSYDDLLTSGNLVASMAADADNVDASNLTAEDLALLSSSLGTNPLFSSNNTAISNLENSSTLTDVETIDQFNIM